ncbi:MAG: cysteine desulfurase NifS [Bacillota bacterium]
MTRKVYLDHNATTPVDRAVVQAMLPYLHEKFGNPSSLHFYGREVRAGVEDAREKVAQALGADPMEIVFTSGGTEADFLALRGAAYANRKRGKHIITSAVEHHAVLDTCEMLAEEGFEVTVVPVDRHGMVDPERVAGEIRPDTILISIMHANNEVGTVQPVREIGLLARERDIVFHTDAVQSFGKIPVNVRELNADLLSISAHKIYGPKGAGALWIRRGCRWSPINRGGGQERRRRPGTENVPGIIGLGEACRLAVSNLDDEARTLKALRNRMVNYVKENFKGVWINGHPEKHLPNSAHFSFEGIEGEALLLDLDLNGIAVSSGSACSSESSVSSHVLLAMGIPDEVARCSIRVSLGKENTEEDVDYFLEVLTNTVNRLRVLSPIK